jgi:hypothetical protein
VLGLRSKDHRSLKLIIFTWFDWLVALAGLGLALVVTGLRTTGFTILNMVDKQIWVMTNLKTWQIHFSIILMQMSICILALEKIRLMTGRHSYGTLGILTLKNTRLKTGRHFGIQGMLMTGRHPYGTQGILTLKNITTYIRLMTGRHSYGTRGILTLKGTVQRDGSGRK